ncbi:MAG: hypothetical protein FRX48_07317 [Lasallia pustulata]|uniref:Uncharacterized protein n=1 Tax=Lasallia pustulata TaxID=136370 RepID=A0A5M8PIV7_9LECA|nr:MAG: hypothetical protein FRX48_07317 [Lasallia pustulata]
MKHCTQRPATAWTFSKATAGSDSVSSVMRTVIVNLLVQPHTPEKLYDKLRSVDVSHPCYKYNELHKLAYACVREVWACIHCLCCRLSASYQREPSRSSGVIYLPATLLLEVYAINRHKLTFGQDAEFSRPERWLENDDEHQKKLEQSMLTVSVMELFLSPFYIHSPLTFANALISCLAPAGAPLWAGTSGL